MPASCDTCPYFFKLENECRYAAPTVFLVPGPGGKPTGISAYPPTRSEKWCGQHPQLKNAGVLVAVS